MEKIRHKVRATIYNASAGSGKTYTLAYKYVRDVIEEPMLYRGILAVTFTNKATEEMKRRILSEIHSLAAGHKSNYLERLCTELSLTEVEIRARAKSVRSYILHDYSRFTILTIDRFFQRIIRAFIQELGLDMNYNIELDPTTILTQSADRIIEQVAENSELKRWISEFIEERIEDGKSWNIQEGILSLSGEIFKESNYDTLESAPSKARLKEIIKSYRARTESTKAQIMAIGAQALSIIESAPNIDTDSFKGKRGGFISYFTRLKNDETKEPTATQRAKAESADDWGKGVEAISQQLQPLLKQAIVLYDENIKLWNTTTLLSENYRSFALLSDLYAMVKEVCNEQNMMLLSETKLILSQFIKDNDAPFIYEKVGNRFERYMIDEFQDTSIKEWSNFLPLVQNAMAQSDKESVLIVGDIKQSIYRWRGGDWRILHSQAREDMGIEQTEVINLKENYRSLKNIVNFNNAIIQSVVSNDSLLLTERLAEAHSAGRIGASARDELASLLSDAYSSHSQIPRKSGDSDGYINITIQEEEPAIIERIKQILDHGFKPSQILLLVRSNAEGVKVAGRLLEFKRENQDERYYFDVMTQEALVVGSSPIAQFVIASLRLALNPNDNIARAIYNRYLAGRELEAPLSDEEQTLLRQCRGLSTEEAFERIVMYHNLSEKASEVAYLQALHEAICGYCSSKSGDISLFLRWWTEHGAARSISVEQSDYSIEITTIHKAKGLEKAVVILPYCSWNLEPKSSGGGRNSQGKPQSGSAVWAEAQEELAELGSFPVKYRQTMGESHFSEQYYREAVYAHIDNINMLYVALTRASQALHIFFKKGKPGIGRAIEVAIRCEGEEFSVGDERGRVTVGADYTSYEIGEMAPPIKESGGEPQDTLYHMTSYPTAKADLRLRLPSQRYFEEQSEEMNPRSQGILMHKAFADSASREDIFASLDLMRLNGAISDEEHCSLSAQIHRSLENPLIAEWFDPEWEDVRCEADIITPRTLHFKRPDRVMISGDRAIVVDYKFGEIHSSAHKKQVTTYMHLLSQMGYTDIKGYIWYIRSGEIVEC